MSNFTNLGDIRRDYGESILSEETSSPDPLAQFKLWFEEVLNSEKNDPTAMVLSTVDEQGHPDSRVVLLKGLDKSNFIFYTNYQSTKAMQITQNPHAALNFYWPQSARQVRVKGKVEKITDKQSDEYFISRPVMSQLSAVISPQSQEIPDRAFLENALSELVKTLGKEHVKRPGYWGGYQIIPDEIEFWQGRDNRLHDRIQYYRQDGSWIFRRLAP